MNTYTSDAIREIIATDKERLFAPWRVGRPETWKPDNRTVEIICIGIWLREELTKIVQFNEDRRAQEAQFNRRSRSEEDIYQVASDVLQQVVENKIDRNRVPLRRWG